MNTSTPSLNIIRSTLQMFRNIWQYRSLIFVLFRRDFILGYRRSFVGTIWILIAPLLSIVSWILMNAIGILNPGAVGVPYPAFVLLSATLWSVFVGAYTTTSDSLRIGSNFMTQLQFPHEILIGKQLLQHLVVSALTLALNLTVLSFFGVISWGGLLLTLMALPLALFGASLGIVISVFSAFLPDIKRLSDAGMNFLIFLTPILYSEDAASPLVRRFLAVNPLGWLIEQCRSVAFSGAFSSSGLGTEKFLWAAAASALLFLVSLRFFYLTERRVVEKLF